MTLEQKLKQPSQAKAVEVYHAWFCDTYNIGKNYKQKRSECSKSEVK